jgi:hypothetical protein
MSKSKILSYTFFIRIKIREFLDEGESCMPKMPRKCPACSNTLYISRLTCPKCGTEVTGNFPPDFLSSLSPNDFDFVVLFLKTKGNIKEMERELGISYWTIRSKLNEIVAGLGFEPDTQDDVALSNRRQKILEKLNAGELTVQEAAVALEQLKKKL